MTSRTEEHDRRRRSMWAMRGAVGIGAVALVVVAIAGGTGSGAHPGGAFGAQPTAATGAFNVLDVVSGRTMTRTSLRGQRTLLFFSEGAGCQACMVQIAQLQKAPQLQHSGIRLMSVTVDSADALRQARDQYGITTPLLADSERTMSTIFGQLGRGGMGHPGIDGHSFVLLDSSGRIVWQQAYTQMYVPPAQLMSDMGA